MYMLSERDTYGIHFAVSCSKLLCDVHLPVYTLSNSHRKSHTLDSGGLPQAPCQNHKTQTLLEAVTYLLQCSAVSLQEELPAVFFLDLFETGLELGFKSWTICSAVLRCNAGAE